MEDWDWRLSEFVYNFARAETPDEFRAALASGIGSVVPNGLAAYTEVDLRRKRVTPVLDRPMPRQQDSLQRLAGLAHQHPLIRRGLRGAHAISDYLTARQFHALELYQDVYRPISAEDQ